mgnify:CR=1 FL=1
MTSGHFTHIHHGKPLIEWSDNIKERHDYVRKIKPKRERALRMALMIRVPDGLIPNAYNEARLVYEEVWRAYKEASRAYWEEAGHAHWEASHEEVWGVYEAVWRAYNEARRAVDWQAIHDASCHQKCPMRDPAATSIFARGKTLKQALR